MESLLTIIRELATADNPAQPLQHLAQQLQEFFELHPFARHLAHRELGRLEPTPVLKYQVAA